MMKNNNTRKVYSTETGRVCPHCGLAMAACRCGENNNTLSASDGVVRVSRETKGRKGKGVTLINGLDLSAGEAKSMAKKLKQLCGTGGTIKNNCLEIQGDHREKIINYLENQNIKVKKAGG